MLSFMVDAFLRVSRCSLQFYKVFLFRNLFNVSPAGETALLKIRSVISCEAVRIRKEPRLDSLHHQLTLSFFNATGPLPAICLTFSQMPPALTRVLDRVFRVNEQDVVGLGFVLQSVTKL